MISNVYFQQGILRILELVKQDQDTLSKSNVFSVCMLMQQSSMYNLEILYKIL